MSDTHRDVGRVFRTEGMLKSSTCGDRDRFRSGMWTRDLGWRRVEEPLKWRATLIEEREREEEGEDKRERGENRMG